MYESGPDRVPSIYEIGSRHFASWLSGSQERILLELGKLREQIFFRLLELDKSLEQKGTPRGRRYVIHAYSAVTWALNRLAPAAIPAFRECTQEAGVPALPRDS